MSTIRLTAAAVAVLAVVTASGGSAEPLASAAPAGPLLADSVAALKALLADAGAAAEVEAVEEGAFMLGAYPRSRVFWRIRLDAPAADDALRRLADEALALRPGVVWFSVPDADGRRRLVTYTDHDHDDK